MAVIKKHCVVTLDYDLKSEKGESLDSSKKSGPMVYIQGAEDILQAIEDAVEGLSVGDSAPANIKPEQAYGEYDEKKLATAPKSAFDGIDEIFPGMQIQEETAEGPLLVTIKEINNDEVLVDANHPLAGQSLHFELTVKDVRDATKEELDHGHVHTEHSHSDHGHTDK